MLSNPRRLFRFVATAEAISWTLLIIGMVLKYVTRTTDLGVRIFGGLHGFVFLAYVLVALALWVDHRWPLRTGALALLSALPPWVTLWFERWVEQPRHGGLQPRWRLGEGGESPASTPERLLAGALRRPGAAALLGVAVIAVVFAVLLWLGPPLPKG